MRLRILELPTEHDGDQMRTPFLYVIDGATDEEADILKHQPPGSWTLGGSQGFFKSLILLGYEEETR